MTVFSKISVFLSAVRLWRNWPFHFVCLSFHVCSLAAVDTFPLPEQLVLQFVSRVIPANGGPRSGYLQLAVLALNSPVLMDTVVSVSTKYMSQKGGAPVSLAISRQSRALTTLRKSLESAHQDMELTGRSPKHPAQPRASKQEILAAIALQVTIGMLSGTSDVKVHLDGAVKLLGELKYLSEETQSFIPRLLCQRISFIDISSSIYWHRRPRLPASFWFFQPNSTFDLHAPSFQDMTGCPHWVLCFLARISHLAQDFADHNDDGDNGDHEYSKESLLEKAFQLQSELITADSTHYSDEGQPLSSSQQHLQMLGKCYYWAAHILLQRRVLRDPRASLRVQYATNTLIELMQSMPIGCGPDSSLSLPLYVAAHEAIRGKQRVRILEKGRNLAQEYPSRTRDAMNWSFEAVWEAIDDREPPDQVHRETSPQCVPDVVHDQMLFIC